MLCMGRMSASTLLIQLGSGAALWATDSSSRQGLRTGLFMTGLFMSCRQCSRVQRVRGQAVCWACEAGVWWLQEQWWPVLCSTRWVAQAAWRNSLRAVGR
jgi:hypothetical protein